MIYLCAETSFRTSQTKKTDNHQTEESLFELFILSNRLFNLFAKGAGRRPTSTLCKLHTAHFQRQRSREQLFRYTHPSSISLEFVYSLSGSSTRPERASERAAERKTTFARCKKFLIFPHSSRLSCAVYTRCIQISRISCIWSEVHFLFFPLSYAARSVFIVLSAAQRRSLFGSSAHTQSTVARLQAKAE